MEVHEMQRWAAAKLGPKGEHLRQMSPDDTERLIHELHTHQIELEMQNDELRRAQEALDESHERYADLYHSAPVGYLTLDAKGVILEANRTIAGMLNQDIEELKGSPLAQFIAHDDQDTFYRLQINLKENNQREDSQAQSCELRLRIAQGYACWMKLDCNATFDGNGDLAKIRVSLNDISERKRAEGLLQQAHDTLESQVTKRTADLQAALRKLDKEIEERKHAEAAEKRHMLETARISRINAMGEMMSEIAHELNQPLAAISIYSDTCSRILESGSQDRESILEALRDIYSQAQRAGLIIKRIREFIGRNEIQLEKMCLDKLFQEVFRLVDLEIRWHGVEMRVEMPNPSAVVKADKILIEQVIINLVRNAVEAMESTPQDERRMVFRTVSHDQDVVISLQDNGQGFSEDDRETMFDPFITTKANGLGMGLAICDSIIEAHEGHLWAKTNNEGGASFFFTLPIHQGEVE
jgi:two-component system sensor kinase FixL